MPSIEFSTTRREAELAGDERGVEAEGVAGERSGAVRRGIRAAPQSREALEVAHERPAVRQQVVGEQHGWACCRWVRPGMIAPRARLACATSASIEVDQERARSRAEWSQQVHPHEGGDLVVAAAAGAQLAAELGADDLDERALERTVHVLVAGSARRAAALDPLEQVVEPGDASPQLVLGRGSRPPRGPWRAPRDPAMS